MKLTTFVQNSAVDVTENEIKDFSEKLKNLFRHFFPKISIENHTWDYVKEHSDKEYPYECVFVKAIFNLELNDYVYGVNGKRETIKFKGLRFELHHETGYCENEEEEKLNVGHKQWQLYIYGIGSAFEYKSQIPYGIRPSKNFQYDTDYNEFDLESVKNWLVETLSFEKATPNVVKKIKARFEKTDK